MPPGDDPMRARGVWLLSASLVLLLAHAFIPTEEFIHRGDDAFYYFKVAANYPRLGFWSFDGIHRTNGVQPLWAMLLAAIAQVLAWLGVTDAHVLARAFVGCAAALQFASSMVLFHVLARQVSVGTAITAAGAFLFPLGIVWTRVWGMENSLYAMTLLSTIAYFHFGFRARATGRTAVLLGLLLGLTTLSRLNAALLIPCLLLTLLASKALGPLSERLRLSVVTGIAASALIVPYFLVNYLATGHLLPISAVVKTMQLDRALDAAHIDSLLSREFLALLYREAWRPMEGFITSRAIDALWIVGGRVVVEGASRYSVVLSALAAFALGPLLFGPPGAWRHHARDRFARLAPFRYVLVFGVVDVALSLWRHPFQARYAIIRWWLVEAEIIIVVLVATLIAASVAYTATRLCPPRLRAPLATVALALLVAFHTQDSLRFYWDGEKQNYDWNLSWNDESYRAAQWISANLPADAVVGSWNAGVLGYYATRPVINLDGLINNFELLPYLREDRVAEYIRHKRIGYLSDMEVMVRRTRLRDHLKLTEVYSRYNAFIRQRYRIYRVD